MSVVRAIYCTGHSRWSAHYVGQRALYFISPLQDAAIMIRVTDVPPSGDFRAFAIAPVGLVTEGDQNCSTGCERGGGEWARLATKRIPRLKRL